MAAFQMRERTDAGIAFHGHAGTEHHVGFHHGVAPDNRVMREIDRVGGDQRDAVFHRRSAGAITCNYDGVMKHHTDIGARAFIGSNTCLVAPVSVGDDAMTATGTVVTKDVPAEAMAVGRARMEVKPGLAVKLFEKLKAAKAKRQKGS